MRRNLIDVKKNFMFELILGKCQKDPDPLLKILICWIRMKMGRIRNPEKM